MLQVLEMISITPILNSWCVFHFRLCFLLGRSLFPPSMWTRRRRERLTISIMSMISLLWYRKWFCFVEEIMFRDLVITFLISLSGGQWSLRRRWRMQRKPSIESRWRTMPKTRKRFVSWLPLWCGFWFDLWLILAKVNLIIMIKITLVYYGKLNLCYADWR